MAFPLRSQTEINYIITAGQLTIADLGLELVKEEKRDIGFNNKNHRDKMYRLILLVSYFQNILNEDGTLTNYYLDAANEKQLNAMLDAIVKLSGIYDGPAIALLAGLNIPLIFVASTGGSSPAPSTSFITEFDNLDVDTPSEAVDSFPATNGNFAAWIYSAKGSNSGEGSRSGLVVAVWQNSSVTFFEFKTEDVIGITSPIVFSVTLSGGLINLIATVATSDWSVRGLRLALNT